MIGAIKIVEATPVVNDAEDGLLSTVGDSAIADVRDMQNMTVLVNHVEDDPAQTNGTASSLDLGNEGTNIDTVIEAASPGEDGDNITITFVADGEGVGTLERNGLAFTFHFEDAVTTVEDFENAVNALEGDDALIVVGTPGTQAAVLAATDDEFGPTNLAGGVDGEGGFTIVLETSIDGMNFAPLATLDETDFPDGSGISVETPVVDGNGMPKRALQVRARLTALDDTSKFSMTVVGTQTV